MGIGYGDDIGEARRLILQAMQGIEGVLSNPAPQALVVDLADSTVNIRARWWVSSPRQADVLDAQDKVLEAIKNTLSAHGIDLPFPTQQILWHDQTEETDGNRQRQREGWPAGQGEVPRSRAEVRQLAQESAQKANEQASGQQLAAPDTTNPAKQLEAPK